MIESEAINVLVSGEVTEEIEEILFLLRDVDAKVTVAAPESVLEKLSDLDPMRFRKVPVRDAAYGESLSKLCGLFEFVRIAREGPFDVLISGFSMLKHRVASAREKIPHVAYMRGLMFDPSVRSGFSDRFESGALGRFFPKKVLQPFGADRILTVSEINKTFLVARGISAENILLCGPVWLHGVPLAPPTSGPGRVFICTSALAAHGHEDAHQRQVDGIAKFLATLEGRERSVVLRVHPRDYFDYSADQRFAAATVDTQRPIDFLRTLTKGDVLVSPPSTLIYEAGLLGVSSVQYKIGETLQSEAALSSIRTPILDLDHVADALDIRPIPANVFTPVNEESLRTVLKDLLS